MIKKTRLATPEEKSLIIHYIKGSQNGETPSFLLWSNFNNTGNSEELWQSASFTVIEVQDFDGKIVVMNQVSNSLGNVLDVITAHYLLNNDNSVVDISNSDLQPAL
ncbi:MAG: hypothetical protein HC880_00130 [Bacteroidia bacterium]|nr:hypothetical protein [Bacteroidia bacterium]